MRQTLDDAGAPLTTTSYDPWGTPQGSLSTPFGFTGELQQQGQVYLRARWYDSGNGTFPTRDPFAGFPERPYSLHPYQYAYSNPVRWTDASGEAVPPPGWPGLDPWCWPGYTLLTTPTTIRCIRAADAPSWLPAETEPQAPLLGIGPIGGIGTTGTLGRAGVAQLPRLPQFGEAGVKACRNLLVGLLVLATAQSDTKTKTRTRRRDQDTIRYFYHGTDTESAMNIVSGGIQPGFTHNKALGDGFYTFVYEDAAEHWSIGRDGPAVVRIGMSESTFKDLKKKKLVREAPWLAYPGAPPEPGLDQVLFKPGAYSTLNSPPVMREWKRLQGNSWTAYTATT